MRLVAIGASWGGLHAVGEVLAGLPADFPAPVVVGQHRAPDSDDALLADLLGRRTPLLVADAEDKVDLTPGRVLLAPAGHHLLVEPGFVSLTLEEPVQHARPSIDVLLESAADAYGPGVVAAVLTGANADGAAGLAAVVRRGGHALVQDPEEAVRDEMPRAALAAVPHARVLPLAQVPAALVELVA